MKIGLEKDAAGSTIQTMTERERENQEADWFSWSTYFTVGFIVGIAFGYFRFIHLQV